MHFRLSSFEDGGNPRRIEHQKPHAGKDGPPSICFTSREIRKGEPPANVARRVGVLSFVTMSASEQSPEFKYNIFLSWSGTRSRWIAEFFFEELPLTIQACKPWISQRSIEKGARSLPEIGKALEGVKFGITFLTPENLSEPWILYEAGALDTKARLFTYLVVGLEPEDVKPPLGSLQHTPALEDHTLTLLKAINKSLDSPLTEKQVESVSVPFWTKLRERLNTLPKPDNSVPEKRDLNDMVAEILADVRVLRSYGVPGNAYLSPMITGNPFVLTENPLVVNSVVPSQNIFRDRFYSHEPPVDNDDKDD